MIHADEVLLRGSVLAAGEEARLDTVRGQELVAVRSAEDGVFRVAGYLILGCIANQALTVSEGNIRWRGAVSLSKRRFH